MLRSDEGGSRSYGWLLAYRHHINRHFSASLSYQNEGHVPRHHRDGYAAQLWASTRLFSPQLSLAAGAGPYRYFDTTRVGETGFADEHGWGMVYSLAATWYSASSPWLYQLRSDRVVLPHGIDTTRLTAGVGYRLERDTVPEEGWGRGRSSEIAVFAGKTILNSFRSETAPARSVELRHAFGPLLRASIAWLDESKAHLVRREGVVAQVWLEPSFQDGRLTLGIGYGPYLASDDLRHERTVSRAGLLTLTASVRLGERWLARVSWNRVVSRDDRDTDVILAGVGYRF